MPSIEGQNNTFKIIVVYIDGASKSSTDKLAMARLREFITRNDTIVQGSDNNAAAVRYDDHYAAIKREY